MVLRGLSFSCWLTFLPASSAVAILSGGIECSSSLSIFTALLAPQRHVSCICPPQRSQPQETSLPEPPTHTSQTPPSHPTPISQGPLVIITEPCFQVPCSSNPVSAPHLPSLGVLLESSSLSCLSYSFPVFQSYIR